MILPAQLIDLHALCRNPSRVARSIRTQNKRKLLPNNLTRGTSGSLVLCQRWSHGPCCNPYRLKWRLHAAAGPLCTFSPSAIFHFVFMIDAHVLAFVLQPFAILTCICCLLLQRSFAMQFSGPDVLRNPEPDFYILGAKSYGR